ncbi:MAG: phosphoglucosamine mutase [Actinomycetes bacterium]
MGRLFGTDGVRGLANVDLTAELALSLSVAAVHILGDSVASSGVGRRPIAVVGRDPRASGEFLEAAVVAGLASAGMDVIRLGVLPTPALAFLTDRLNADFGVMLSASHNPMPDNGIKFFARGGHKLADEIENAIEARLAEPWQRPIGADVGRVSDEPEAVARYVEHLLAGLPNSLTGLRVVVDGANGAASTLAPEVYRLAGAEVIAIHCSPDGLNINLGCGSTHLDDLKAAVREHGADIGIAHDGDADRCLAVAADGSEIDGDHILAILALALRDSGRLPNQTVVSTVMANLGFRIAMDAHGIKVVETAVGDRYVLEAMREGAFNLGGEQSGHVVIADQATTGDGLLTALLLMARLAQTRSSLGDLAGIVRKYPQVLLNVSGIDRSRLGQSVHVSEAVATAEARLAGAGRVLLRPSGTEAVVRVMVEAESDAIAQEVADHLADVLRTHLSE